VFAKAILNAIDLTKFYTAFTDTASATSPGCRQAFTDAFNATFTDPNSNVSYTYPQIEAIYLLYCDRLPAICTQVQIQSCNQITGIYESFMLCIPIRQVIW